MIKYYVVSEEELERLHSVAFAEGVMFCGEEGPDYDYERFKTDDNSNLSMAACRARSADKLLAVIEAASYIDKGMRGEVSTTEAEWLAGRKKLKDALAALED